MLQQVATTAWTSFYSKAVSSLTLAELHVSALTSFIKFNNLKALTKGNEALSKPFHGLIEILLFDFRYHGK